jgi:hypothetical protein
LKLELERQPINAEVLVNSEKSRQPVTQRGAGNQVMECEETTCLQTCLGL